MAVLRGWPKQSVSVRALTAKSGHAGVLRDLHSFSRAGYCCVEGPQRAGFAVHVLEVAGHGIEADDSFDAFCDGVVAVLHINGQWQARWADDSGKALDDCGGFARAYVVAGDALGGGGDGVGCCCDCVSVAVEGEELGCGGVVFKTRSYHDIKARLYH